MIHTTSYIQYCPYCGAMYSGARVQGFDGTWTEAHNGVYVEHVARCQQEHDTDKETKP